MSFLRSIFERRDLTAWPGIGEDPSRIPSPSEEWASWAGVPVTEERALRQLAVWACASLITDTISTLPLATFRDVEGAPKRITDPKLIDQPYSEIERNEWLAIMCLSLVLRGNAYGWIIDRDRMGIPTQIKPLHPDQVTPRRDRRTGEVVYKLSGQKDRISALDMMHVRGMTMPGKQMIEGLDPISYARQTIGAALATEEYAARYFGESANPSGLLSSDKPIDQDTAEEMQRRWMTAHGHRHRRPAVLGGGLDFKAIMMNPQESQFLSTIKAKRSEIAGFFRVPPHMIGEVDRSTTWGTGIENQMLGFVSFTLSIWIVRLERAISRILLGPQYVKLNVAGLLRGRTSERYRAYVLARQGGFMSINEIRALEELEPYDDPAADGLLVPLNYGVIPGDDDEPNGPMPAPEPVEPPEPAESQE